MKVVIIAVFVTLVLGLIVVSYFGRSAIRQHKAAHTGGAAGVTLAPWEVDQRLPMIPAELTTRAVPIVPVPSGTVLTAEDVSPSYPEAGAPAHFAAREFSVETEFQTPRHAR